ncbi:DUF4382 domain-containing protein [Winogradskyella alexanderae]|uniref:DUF4382 domain-containing protein n=1 Tax=Winogradskyella alexanderae TaxID=2877123 RepID=A0ABS7XM86_9FLAO|nr:DUF4382 domain-containing protein [Winogradskyella alexanderae]MCA0131112.1 DUF4382 domain-containing protein [Winogradskyella alexanderae]
MKNIRFYIIACLTFIGVSCNDTSYQDNDDTAYLSIRLVDEPGDYESVFVEVLDVMIKYENTESAEEDSGWESIGILNPGVYDLLELTGGVSLQLLDNEEIQTGIIKQIRLILGDDNSLLIEGAEEPISLNTPSAQQSGLKVMVNQDIQAGFNYDFVLDFDVDESIVMAGNSGNYNLKPVLRASLEINSGTMIGNVQPTDIVVEVEASNGIDTASTYVDSEGNFEIPGLSEGAYTVTVAPDNDSGLSVQIIENVEVNTGEISDLGTIILE